MNPSIHWPTTPAEGVELQKQMARMVKIQPLPSPPRILAAIDLAHIGSPRRPTHQAAGIIVYDLEKKETIERRSVIRPVTFPYIPGLLSFREAPAALEVIELISTPVDVFLIDGQGLAHPRRIGIASHLGILIDRPTIGCAKSRLTGQPQQPLPARRGSRINLLDGDEIIGAIVRTRTKVKPLYVSIGNLITLEECIEVVLKSADRYRLPEPARLAHNYVTMIAKGVLKPDEHL
ncbi:MAG: endonuclease V [Phycisphaerae bacterium]